MLFSELRVGMSVTKTFVVADEKIRKAADLFEDHNPLHLDEEYAVKTMFGGRIAHGKLVLGLSSGLFGEKFPGEGTVYIGIDAVRFLRPVRPGDEVVITATLAEIVPAGNEFRFPTARCTVNWSVKGKTVLTAIEIITKKECLRK